MRRGVADSSGAAHGKRKLDGFAMHNAVPGFFHSTGRIPLSQACFPPGSIKLTAMVNPSPDPVALESFLMDLTSSNVPPWRWREKQVSSLPFGESGGSRQAAGIGACNVLEPGRELARPPPRSNRSPRRYGKLTTRQSGLMRSRRSQVRHDATPLNGNDRTASGRRHYA